MASDCFYLLVSKIDGSISKCTKINQQTPQMEIQVIQLIIEETARG